MAFLLDANVFIEAKKRHYGMEFCPAFWDFLLRKNASGDVRSIDRVKKELFNGNDELKQWASQRGPQFFVQPGSGVDGTLKQLTNWATTQGARYSQGAVAGFLDSTDYFLVAQAQALGDIVVTHEIPEMKLSEIKIPEACVGMGLHWVTPWEMLRQLKARFVLPGQP